MHSEPANHIPISEILGKLNILPLTSTRRYAIYPSPFHPERAPTLKIDLIFNQWEDGSIGTGGGLVDFVGCYLKVQQAGHTPSDIRRWIKNMTEETVIDLPAACREADTGQDSTGAWVLKSRGVIRQKGLIQYLVEQGIPLAIAERYLLQLQVRNKNTGKRFYALGFLNEDGGFEVSSPFLQGCVRPKALSFIRGRSPQSPDVHVFYHFWDYLSAVTRNKEAFQSDSIILNGYSCLRQVPAYLKNYGYSTLYSWMDNAPAGEAAAVYLSNIVKTIPDLKHKMMNAVYAPYLDVHGWHRQLSGLSA